MMKIKVSLSYKLIEYFAVLMIIISSGSLYFVILNCFPTLMALLFSALLVTIVGKVSLKTLQSNLLTCGSIIIGVVINLLLNFEYTTLDKDFIILLIRLISLVAIQSVMTFENFAKKYVKIMVALACLSLVCFLYTMLISYRLPGIQVTEEYIYSFYHTVGTNYIYERNSGIFWEAPAHAIFLNYALSLVICRRELFSNKEQKLYLIVLALCILTTVSIYAYACIGLNGILYLFYKSKSRENTADKKSGIIFRRRWKIILTVLALLLLIIIEIEFNLIGHKLINRKGSFTTRFDDTYYTLQLAFRRLLIGFGIFETYTQGILYTKNVVNNSNGLAILLMKAGLPLFLLAVSRVLLMIKKQYQAKKHEMLWITLLLFLFHFSEHIWLYTLFISMLFQWKKTDSPRKLRIESIR